MKEKLKILFLVRTFPVTSETFIINQIIDLIDRGHEVRIFSFYKGRSSFHPKAIAYNLDRLTIYPEFPDTAFKRIQHFVKILFETKNTRFLNALNIFKYGKSALSLSNFYHVANIRKLGDDFDIVHAHFGMMYKTFFIAQDLGLLLKSSLITTFHGYDMAVADLKKNKRRYKELFDKNVLVTVNNEYGQSILHKIKPGYKNIALLPVGLNTDYYQPDPDKTENKNFTLLYCGRFIKWKGPLNVIEIANIIINNKGIKDVRFQLIGEGNEFENVKTLIRHYRLQNYIELLGARSQDEVIETMKKADVFILPGFTDEKGRAETQGLVIQEAQSMELPVIVTDAGGMKYGVIHNENGYIVNENDLNSFADKIEELKTDQKKRVAMGKAGREYAIAFFDSKRLGERLLTLYNTLIKQ